MKILVCGGRDFTSYELIKKTLDSYKGRATHIIHGGARGVDSLAGKWALENFPIQEVICPANWQYGRGAGSVRNRKMAELGPDLIIAFPGGAGTQSMKRIGTELKITVLSIG